MKAAKWIEGAKAESRVPPAERDPRVVAAVREKRAALRPLTMDETAIALGVSRSLVWTAERSARRKLLAAMQAWMDGRGGGRE